MDMILLSCIHHDDFQICISQPLKPVKPVTWHGLAVAKAQSPPISMVMAPDVTAANRTGDLYIFRNDGRGNFTLVEPSELEIRHRAFDGITTADVNNNGHVDVFLVSVQHALPPFHLLGSLWTRIPMKLFQPSSAMLHPDTQACTFRWLLIRFIASVSPSCTLNPGLCCKANHHYRHGFLG